MTRDRKDRSANWLIDRHGNSVLRLAKITDFTSWRPAPTVLSFPKQMPDGLLDVTFPQRPTPDPFIIEVETYPDAETAAQLRDDAAMVLLTRGVLPDIVLLVLASKGNQTDSPEQIVQSAHGLSELRLRIHVINLWMLSAEELLAANDVGLIPWVPLTQYAGPPEVLLSQCRDRIEQQAPPAEKANLLATTRVMAEMRYNDNNLLSLLGGQVMSMEKVFDASPTIQRIKAESTCSGVRESILWLLAKRFGAVPEDLTMQLRLVTDVDQLKGLLAIAYECADLDGFRLALLLPR